MPSQDRAMIEKARADVSTLEQAVETYRLENLVYPRTDQGLDALLHAPSGLARPERYRSGGYIRSEEHTSELQSLMRSSYAVFCLKKKKQRHEHSHSQLTDHNHITTTSTNTYHTCCDSLTR